MVPHVYGVSAVWPAWAARAEGAGRCPRPQGSTGTQAPNESAMQPFTVAAVLSGRATGRGRSPPCHSEGRRSHRPARGCPGSRELPVLMEVCAAHARAQRGERVMSRGRVSRGSRWRSRTTWPRAGTGPHPSGVRTCPSLSQHVADGEAGRSASPWRWRPGVRGACPAPAQGPAAGFNHRADARSRRLQQKEKQAAAPHHVLNVPERPTSAPRGSRLAWRPENAGWGGAPRGHQPEAQRRRALKTRSRPVSCLRTRAPVPPGPWGLPRSPSACSGRPDPPQGNGTAVRAAWPPRHLVSQAQARYERGFLETKNQALFSLLLSYRRCVVDMSVLQLSTAGTQKRKQEGGSARPGPRAGTLHPPRASFFPSSWPFPAT